MRILSALLAFAQWQMLWFDIAGAQGEGTETKPSEER
jgi:hypothetical protein